MTVQTVLPAAGPAPPASPGAASAAGGDRALVIALAVLGLLALISLTAPIWWSHSPTATDPLNALQSPGGGHPMGTDEVGRDVFARFLAGARISLAVGLGVSVAAGVVGTALGLLGGLRQGWVDASLMRLFDIILAFPPLILAMAITVGLGVGLISACIGITLSSVPYVGRIVRSDVLRVRNAGYVESASALGLAPSRIVRRHVFPHVLPTVLVQSASAFSFAILSVAGLGFIGLAAQIPTPEWGAMITQGSQLLIAGQWWVSVFPGIGILIATCAAMVVAERVRVRLDPRRTAR